MLGHSLALSYPGSVATHAYFINASGEVVGQYTDSAGHSQYFTYDNGTYTPIIPPADASSQSLLIVGINASGTILGHYNDSAGAIHNFTYNNGVYSSVDAPGLGAFFQVTGIDDSGQIIGNVDFSSSASLLTPVEAALFTTSADTVNFNALTAFQKGEVVSGADHYHGLGGSDVVTLPNVANYNASVGGSATLGWANSSAQPFVTGSEVGDKYTVTGNDGNYFIAAGAGADTIKTTGNGSSTVIAGGGTANVEFDGTGANTIHGGSGGIFSAIVIKGGGNNVIDGTANVKSLTVSTGGRLSVEGDIHLSAATIAANANVTVSGATLELQGNVNNAGTFALAASPGNAVLSISGTVTLTGGGQGDAEFAERHQPHYG